jgi:hypothetical protein
MPELESVAPQEKSTLLLLCPWMIFFKPHLYLMKSRDKLFHIFTIFCVKIHTQFGIHMQTLHGDNSDEYMSLSFSALYGSTKYDS